MSKMDYKTFENIFLKLYGLNEDIVKLFITIMLVVVMTGCLSMDADYQVKISDIEPKIDGVLAINYFDNRLIDENHDWVSLSVTDFLTAEMTSHNFLQIISQDHLDSVIAEQKLTLSGLTDDTLEVGHLLKSDYLLNGDYYINENIITVNARLQDTTTGEILFAVQVRDSMMNFYQVQERVLYKLYDYLNINLTPSQLAAKDYVTDTNSLNLFYQAETLAAKGKKEAAKNILKKLLSGNQFFDPAQKRLDELSGVSVSNRKAVSGRQLLAESDTELRKQIYYKNLTHSFVTYSEEAAYNVEIEEPLVDTLDGQKYSIQIKGKVYLDHNYLRNLYIFVKEHVYLESAEEFYFPPGHNEYSPSYSFTTFKERILENIESQLRNYTRIRRSSQPIFIKFNENMLDGIEDYAKLSIFLVDKNNDFYHSFGPEEIHIGEPGTIAIFGGTNHQINNALYLSQPSFSINAELKREDIEKMTGIDAVVTY